MEMLTVTIAEGVITFNFNREDANYSISRKIIEEESLLFLK